MNLFILQVQAAQADLSTNADAFSESYLGLLMKGGWIMIPIILLSILSVYFIIERYLVIRKLGAIDMVWTSRVEELVSERKVDQAIRFCLEKPYILAKIIAAGLKDKDEDVEDIEKTMEVEARIQISRLESHMNYLSVIASIAPMLGFLGTIFGVIKIFYNISQTADLNIATISDGLYQKMICSGSGLLVGIIAFAGYYVLNGFIDKIVLNLDKESNRILKEIKKGKIDKKVINVSSSI